MSFELVGVKLVADDGGFFGTMAKADSAVDNFGKQTKQTFGQMPGLADIAVGAFHAIGTVAVDAFFKAGQAAVGFFTDSISAAGDFEAGMNSFAAVAGGALDEAGLKTEDFKKLFLDLGKKLPVSTKEVQDAATEMIKGGIDPATVAAGGLEQNIKFAAAAMEGDLAGAAEVSAKILGGWAEQGATAAEKAALLTSATDLLTKAANASTVDVKELALGLYNVQGTAKATGLSLDETTTALAELAPRFASSSEAGTSFKNFLIRLQPQTKNQAGAMQALGLYTEKTGSAFFDAQGKFVGVAKASQLLQDSTKGLTAELKVQYLQQIFGNDAMNAAGALAEMGAQGYDDMAAAMAKQNGVQATAQTVQQGYNVALDNFHGSIEALQITIGSVLLPILSSFFNDYLSPGINILTDLATAGSISDETFAGLSPTMQSLVTIISELWGTIQSLISVFQSAGDESSALGGVLNDLSGVWDALLSAIDAAGAGYQAIIDAVLPIVQSFIEDHGTEIMAFFKDMWDTIVEIITIAINIYKAIVPPILQAIAAFITEHGTEIKAILTNVWNAIKSVIDIVLTLIKGILKTALQLIQGDWEGAWNTVKETLSRVWEDIKVILESAVDTAKQVLSIGWDEIKDGATAAWEGIADAIGTAFGGVGDAIKGIVNEAIDYVNSLIDAYNAVADVLDLSQIDHISHLATGTANWRGGAALVGESGPELVMLPRGSRVQSAASTASLMAGAAPSMTTNSQQRTINLNYNTQYAPPASQSLAMAHALG